MLNNISPKRLAALVVAGMLIVIIIFESQLPDPEARFETGAKEIPAVYDL